MTEVYHHGHRELVGKDARVTINGEVGTRVIRACPSEGWAVRHVLDSDGRPAIEGDEFATERVEGEVVVEVLDESVWVRLP